MTKAQAIKIVAAIENHVISLIESVTAEMGSEELGKELARTRQRLTNLLIEASYTAEGPS